MDTSELLLTAAIGLTTVYIAWRQWRTEVVKTRLDLFDRRIRVFEETMAFLSVVIRDGDPSVQELSSFQQTATKARFLLGRQVSDYLHELHRNAVDLRSVVQRSRHVEHQPIDDERRRLGARDAELFKWFGAQFDASVEMFAQRLDLGEI